MQALVYDGNLHLSEQPLAPIPPGEVRIQVSRASICNTDLEICRGYMGFQGILGHEFVGRVVKCHSELPDDIAQRWLDKRVVGEINCGCGQCPLCLQGDTRHCPNRTTLGIDRRPGAMAEYFNLPVENLYEVPPQLSDDEAVFTEPLAAAWNILEQVHLQPNSRVLVLGDGKLGQLVAQVLRLSGCHLLVVGKHPEKLAILTDLGIAVSTLEQWEDQHRNEPACDVVVEATGSAQGLDMAINAVRPRGIIVLKSTVADNSNLNLAPIVIHEITVVGSRCGRFAPALRSLADGLIKVKPLISAHYSLSDGVEAFRCASSGAMKVLLDVADSSKG